MEFVETVGKLRQMAKIKFIAWHVFEDYDRIEYSKNLVMIEDINGERLEVVLHDPYALAYKTLYSCDCVLVFLMLRRLYNDNGMSYDTLPFGVYMNLSGEVNKARKIFPYNGKKLLNEREVRLYDDIPELLF